MLLKLFLLLGISAYTVVCSQQVYLERAVQIYDVLQKPISGESYVQIIAFIDMTCRICFYFLNVWNAVPGHLYELTSYLRIGIVDCTVHKMACLNYNMTVTPTIRYFPPNCPLGFPGVNLPAGEDLKTNVFIILNQITGDVRSHVLSIPEDLIEQVRRKPIIEPQINVSVVYPDEIPNPPTENPIRPPPANFNQSSEECANLKPAFPWSIDVVEVNSLNVNIMLAKNTSQIVVIGFYDVSCRPCYRFMDIWNQFSMEMRTYKGVFKVAVVNCAVERELCDRRFLISHYPSIRYISGCAPFDALGIDIIPRLDYDQLKASIYQTMIAQNDLIGRPPSVPIMNMKARIRTELDNTMLRSVASAEGREGGIESEKKETKSEEKEIESVEKRIESEEKGIKSEEKGTESGEKAIKSVEKRIESEEKEIKSEEKGIESVEKRIESGKKGIESVEKRLKTGEKGIKSEGKGIESEENKIKSVEKRIESEEMGIKSVEKTIESEEKGVKSVGKKIDSKENGIISEGKGTELEEKKSKS